MSLKRSGVHSNALNPEIASKLIKYVVYASELYGCDLLSLTKTDIIMLERAQHFIMKFIQGFEDRTRTDMCTALFGLDMYRNVYRHYKLLFLGRLCRLDKHSFSLCIL